MSSFPSNGSNLFPRQCGSWKEQDKGIRLCAALWCPDNFTHLLIRTWDSPGTWVGNFCIRIWGFIPCTKWSWASHLPLTRFLGLNLEPTPTLLLCNEGWHLEVERERPSPQPFFHLCTMRCLFCFLNFIGVDLQCCISFRCTAKWIRYIFFSFPYRLLTRFLCAIQ